MERQRIAYSVVFLFILTLGLGIGNLFWTAHEVGVNNSARARQGVAIEKKLCSTLHALVVLRPPSGPASANPARGYEQSEHRVLAQLYSDVGCGTAPYLKASASSSPPAAAPVPSQPVTVSHPGAAPSVAPVIFAAAGSPAASPAPSPAPAVSPEPAGSPPSLVSVPGVLSVSPPCATVLVLRVCI